MTEIPVSVPRGTPPPARYALGELLRLLGLEARDAPPGEAATIGYGSAPDAVRIPAGPPDGWDDPRPRVARDGALAVVHRPGGGTGALAAPTALGFDALYATYACLTAPWERLDPADEMGTPVAAEGWLARSGLLDEPLVHRYAAVLGGALRAAGVELPPPAPPRLVLTHDVDDNFSHLFARRESLELLRRDLRSPARAARRAAGLARRLVRRPAHDPNDRFDDWADWHAGWGSRPAYFAASHGLFQPDSARIDVPYDARHPEVAATLRRAAAGGAEIGIHFSVRAAESADRLRAEREALEDIVGAPVRSARHHWWAVGSPPEAALARQARAGIEVDCSLGFNDRAGFRRGIAAPFRPWDRERATSLEIWALPTIAMDAALSGSGGEAVLEQLRALWRPVAEVSGALVLDWHVHAANPAALPGAADGLRAFMDEALSAGARTATPLELAREAAGR